MLLRYVNIALVTGPFTNLRKKFFLAWAFQNPISTIYNGLEQRHLLAGFGSGRDARTDNVCCCCASKCIRDRSGTPQQG